MREWNVVVTVRERGFIKACEILEQMGTVSRTGFYNVLVMKVDDIDAFLDAFAEDVARHEDTLEYVARVAPARTVFNFSTAEEFEDRAREHALALAPGIAGRSFHVRLHRRGFKGRLKSPQEERFLDDLLLAEAERAGAPARIDFDDPDAVLAVDTVGNRAGMSLWTRDDLRRYPFLKVD